MWETYFKNKNQILSLFFLPNPQPFEPNTQAFLILYQNMRIKYTFGKRLRSMTWSITSVYARVSTFFFFEVTLLC